MVRQRSAKPLSPSSNLGAALNNYQDTMKENDPFYEKRLNRLFVSFYFFPMVGIIPTLLTKMRQGESNSTASLSLKIHALWAISYSLLWLGSLGTTENMAFRLLYLNTLVTSGYILTCFFLVLKTWRNKR